MTNIIKKRKKHKGWIDYWLIANIIKKKSNKHKVRLGTQVKKKKKNTNTKSQKNKIWKVLNSFDI